MSFTQINHGDPISIGCIFESMERLKAILDYCEREKV